MYLVKKTNESDLPYTMRDDMLNCDHAVAWEGFSTTGRESKYYLLETKESLFIKQDNHSLKKNKYSHLRIMIIVL